MEIPIYQIDAFASRVFTGNPAAVCPLEKWLPDTVMQAIAQENNLSETAFFVQEGDGYHIRWFTPKAEVDLCGHATLGSAYVLFECIKIDRDTIRFKSKSGPLTVTRQDHLMTLDFPVQQPKPCDPPKDLLNALRVEPKDVPPEEVLLAEDYIIVYAAGSDVSLCRPDFGMLKGLEARGVAITAPGNDVDFVSRFFAPNIGIDEDPVTGSVHCALTPYWSRKLGKKRLVAHQLSERGGQLICTDEGDRILISGQAVEYLKGEITL
ncbi:PhzF family phenazine biosynthesis protein [bacterium]